MKILRDLLGWATFFALLYFGLWAIHIFAELYK